MINWKILSRFATSFLVLLIGIVFITIKSQTPLSVTQDIKGTQISQNVNPSTYKVLKVVDGDTIKVETLGTLRLIGIDTPETVDPRKPVQCFGKEASDRAKILLTDQNVKLEFDDSQSTLDKYGRTLAYVYLEDGTMFNLKMIREGYAHEYTYSAPYRYQKEFKDAQKLAQTELLGLWGDICN